MAYDGSDVLVSIIIPAKSEGENLIDTVAAVRENSGGLTPEIIVVDDGSEDGAPQRLAARFANDSRLQIIAGPDLGIARARNAGAGVARGEVLVFLDGHCFVPPGWLEPLVAPFADPRVAMTGPAFRSIRDHRARACGITWTDASLGNVWLPAETCGAVPFHIGACQAVRAETFAAEGGFDPGMTRWGSEDVELCLRLWLMGHDVHAAPQSEVYHLFRDARPYSVDTTLILYNHLRLALLHFDEGRLEQVIARLQAFPGSAGAISKAFTDSTLADRDRMHARRARDVGWLFQRFGIGF
ncbi:MAG: glycosyltransferase [Rhodobacterales bacterium]|nr:glycosyltransferase [Rhodobacterales bacterium]